MSLSKQDQELLEALNALPENVVDEKWRARLGDEEYFRVKNEMYKHQQKKADKHISNLIAKYEKTGDRNCLSGLDALGYPLAD